MRNSGLIALSFQLSKYDRYRTCSEVRDFGMYQASRDISRWRKR